MGALTPDRGLSRRLAIGYLILVLAVLASAAGAFLLLERREEDRLRDEISSAAHDGAARLSRELKAAFDSLTATAADPLPPAARELFEDGVAVGSDGKRIFPPVAREEPPEGGGPDIEAVENAEALADRGRELEALDIFDLGAKASTPGVAWRCLMGAARVFERSAHPERALPYLERAGAMRALPLQAFTARIKLVDLRARVDGESAARAQAASILDDLAAACESWRGREPAAIEPASVRLIIEKASERCRSLGVEPSQAAAARIDRAMASLHGIESIARAVASAPPGVALLSVGDATQGSEPCVVFCRKSGERADAFCLRWHEWGRRANAVCEEIRASAPKLAFRLIAPGEKTAQGFAAARFLGPAPLDRVQLEAAPAAGAIDAALFGFRLRTSLVLGVIAALFLAAAGLGARNLARSAALDRARAEFALSASHEIKTPLTLIRAAAETLAAHDLDPEGRRAYLRTLVVESRRLSDIVGRVLDLRKLEEAPGPPERAPCDLASLVGEVVTSFGPLLADAGMSCDLDAPGPVEALVDAETIACAIIAVVENAVRYTPPDAAPERRRIAVRVRREGTYAIIEVADRGIGIPPAEREKVFERYYRVRSELFARVRGAGLGLSIVREIVARHGGEARIDANEPQGTVVRLRLPLEE